MYVLPINVVELVWLYYIIIRVINLIYFEIFIFVLVIDTYISNTHTDKIWIVSVDYGTKGYVEHMSW